MPSLNVAQNNRKLKKLNLCSRQNQLKVVVAFHRNGGTRGQADHRKHFRHLIRRRNCLMGLTKLAKLTRRYDFTFKQ